MDEVDKKLLLTSPNYPNQYTSNLRCNFLIKVSFQGIQNKAFAILHDFVNKKTSIPGKRLSVEGLDLDLEQTGNTCVDGLELRYYSLGQPGPL